jgi:lysophospholipase L1-like esterase
MSPHHSHSGKQVTTTISDKPRRYLALGDSMSIDLYTGVSGGGAVSQFYQWLKSLGQLWTLADRTSDGCRMRYVPASATGDLITLTIGGNDLLAEQQTYLQEGLERFALEHIELLTKLRAANPDALVIVGNVYASQTPLPDHITAALDQANAIIAANVQRIGGHLADIRGAFRGHEQEYLCYDIEPSLKGAAVIADLFKQAVW